MRPRPQRGQGWRKGGFKFFKKDFFRALKFKISLLARHAWRDPQMGDLHKIYYLLRNTPLNLWMR